VVENELLSNDEAVRKANLIRVKAIPGFIIKRLNEEIVESLAENRLVIKFALINREYSDYKELLIVLLKERGYKNVTAICVDSNSYIQFNA
jgi:hypothetical protein